MLNKLWNGRLTGLFSVIYICFSVCMERLYDKITQILFLNNINKRGNGCVVYRGLYYRNPKYIELGDNVIIGKNNTFSAENSVDKKLSLVIENGVSIGNDCKIDFTGGILIKSNAHLAHEVMISTHDHGYDYKSIPIGRSLEIGENAFIGNKVIIMHNCNYIGKYSVIGTGSVVTKDVPDYAVVAGNPARIIKMLENQ